MEPLWKVREDPAHTPGRTWGLWAGMLHWSPSGPSSRTARGSPMFPSHTGLLSFYGSNTCQRSTGESKSGGQSQHGRKPCPSISEGGAIHRGAWTENSSTPLVLREQACLSADTLNFPLAILKTTDIPGYVGQLVRASSRYTKVAGLIPCHGTYKNQINECTNK